MEDVAGAWLIDLLGLPPESSVGFVTGGQMANFTCSPPAATRVLATAGWDVEAPGLQGAAGRRLVGEHAHVTIFLALRLLGLGAERSRRVAADDAGTDASRRAAGGACRRAGPTIVCAQAGNVNTGAFDPFEAIAAACAENGAWLHVDGAFGLWAAAAPSRRHLVRGLEGADSWAHRRPQVAERAL